MRNTFNRLQFVKHEEVFATREDAINYVLDIQTFERPSLVAEPMIMLYESGSAAKGPNVILAIGSVGDGVSSSNANRTFFIDTQKTEEEIEELREEIEKALQSLSLIPLNSDTIELSSEKTDEGTILSGDVKIADYRIVSGKVYENLIETEGNKGIYAFVDMEYDDENNVIKFITNKVSKEFQLPKDQHLEKGWYDPTQESLFFKLADGTQVKVLVTKLIEEWTVLDDASETPIILHKEHSSATTVGHEGIYDWQDVLEADVRVADHITDNILHKDRTGRYLYVKGTADNIQYKNGMTVKDALDDATMKVSSSAGNLIYNRPDGIYATAMLDYNQAENKLIYKYSDFETQSIKEVEFKLNSVKVLEDITYDPINEMIVIRYIDAEGEYQRVEIPVADIIEEWEVNNEAHNIKLVKYRSQGQGKDILSADAKLHVGDNNILEDLNHELYVNGVSNNIKYDVTGNTTVKEVLDNLSNTTSDIHDGLIQEIANRELADDIINRTIGSGFSTDAHETVTYKFNELNGKVDSEISRSTDKDTELESKIDAEITRSTTKDTEHDNSISDIETTIGDDFSTDAHETVSYKFNELTNTVNSISGDLTAEINRSTEKDDYLENKIAEEQNRALDAESTIANNLSDEVSRATAKETEIENKFDEELGEGFDVRNTVRDEIDSLNGKVITEINDRTQGDAVLREIITSVSGDLSTTNENVNTISGKLDTEINRSIDKDNELEGKINASSGDIAELSDKVDYIDDEYLINFDGTASISISKTKAAKGYIVTANSNIDDSEDNNVKLTRAGLYSKVNLEYNELTNTLRFTNSNGSNDIKLVSNSIIDRVYYDPTREAIIIEYTINGERQEDVVVPVRDLINEIDVANTDTVTLTKTVNTGTNADIITADVNLNTFHEDNILVNDGGLYVSGAKIEQNAENISALTNSLNNEIERAQEAENALDDKVNDNTEAIENLEDLIDAISGNADTSLKEIINNDHSIDVDNTNATKPVIKVNVSSEVEDGKQNIIKLNNDGLYVGVDLDYNFDGEIGTNQLIFKTTYGTKTFDLKTNSVVDKIYYDASRESIVIEYTVNGHRMPDVVIPVGDLIDEWRVDEGHDGAIKLEKERVSGGTQDILKASVVLSNSHNDNIIVNDNGALYVSGAQISANTQAIEEEIARSTNADNALDAKIDAEIDAEIARATSVEDGLTTAISNEVSRATAKENQLETAITDEVTRSTTKETELQNSISAESIRALSAETALGTRIDSEAVRASNKETNLDIKIDAEIARATNAENDLLTAINAEAASRVAADTSLQNAIENITWQCEDTTSVDLNIDGDKKLTAAVKLQDGNNIIKVGQGLYASVSLSYNPGTNKLKLVTSNGDGEEIQLIGATLLENIVYDPINKELVITYKDGTGSTQVVRFGVAELFNEWDVENQTDGSAINLVKESNVTETGTVDKLKANVILTNLDDNMVKVIGNGLYVSRGPIDEISGSVATLSGDTANLREDLNKSLAVEETSTLKLNRDINYKLSGNVKVSPNEKNLIKVDETLGGLSFDGDIDCGEY